MTGIVERTTNNNKNLTNPGYLYIYTLQKRKQLIRDTFQGTKVTDFF